jgi:hypothetical protein
MKSPVQEYLEHLDDLAGKQGVYHLATKEQERPALWSIIYRDTPDEGSLTAFTYGLSAVTHPEWRLGRPELVISVDNTDRTWGLAIGELARRHRGRCPFSYGNVVRFGTPVSKDSPMSAFLIFAPTIIDVEQCHIILRNKVINIVQAYPIYEEEIAVVEQYGAQDFFMRKDIDFYNVRRENVGA